MRWPWVARSTLEAVEGERDRLIVALDRQAAQIEKLLAHRVEIERREAGLGKEGKKAEPMPEDVKLAIESWDSPVTREKLMQDAFQTYRKTGSWEVVRASLKFDGETS